MKHTKAAVPLPIVIGLPTQDAQTAAACVLPVAVAPDTEVKLPVPQCCNNEAKQAAFKAALCGIADYMNCTGDRWGILNALEILLEKVMTAEPAFELVYFEPGADQDSVIVFRDPDTDKHFLYESGHNTALFRNNAQFAQWKSDHLMNFAQFAEMDEESCPEL